MALGSRDGSGALPGGGNQEQILDIWIYSSRVKEQHIKKKSDQVSLMTGLTYVLALKRVLGLLQHTHVPRFLVNKKSVGTVS